LNHRDRIMTSLRTDTPVEMDATAVPRVPQRDSRSRWLARVPRDVVLVVAGALLAFATEEWRDARRQRARVDVAVTSIRNELLQNRTLVANARDHHRHVADTLAKLVTLHLHPDVAIYSNGMWNPAFITSTAWQAARETGALADMPLATVLKIAPVYEAQDRYRAATEALGAAIMNDVRHEGIDAVLRDQFSQFISLDIDFANRESRLLAAYDKALSQLPAQH
jgi:hypothetical protein